MLHLRSVLRHDAHFCRPVRQFGVTINKVAFQSHTCRLTIEHFRVHRREQQFDAIFSWHAESPLGLSIVPTGLLTLPGVIFSSLYCVIARLSRIDPERSSIAAPNALPNCTNAHHKMSSGTLTTLSGKPQLNQVFRMQTGHNQSVRRGAAERVVSKVNVDWRRPGQRCRYATKGEGQTCHPK